MRWFVGEDVGHAGAQMVADEPPHVEQAVFADELSAQSVEAFGHLAKAQWQALLAASVPTLQALVDGDAAAGRAGEHRVRIGLYTYHDAAKEAPSATPTTARIARSARRRTPPKDR